MKRRLVALVLAGTLIFGNSAYAEEAVTGNPIAEDTVGSAIEDPFDESIVEDSEAAGSGSFDEGIIENCESADVNSSDEDTDALVDEDTDAPEDGILFEEAEVDTISREDGGLIVDLQPDTVSIEDHSDFDADQALMQYLNSTFQAKPAPHKPARIARREKKDLLGEKEKVVYDQILPQVKEIVNGNKTDSHIEIDYTKFPGYKDRFYESDLGCTLVDQGEMTKEAQNALTEIISYDLGLTVDALRYDHPELFFWYGRASASGGNGLSISGGYDYDKNAYYLTLSEPAGILDMSLSAAYRAAGSDPYAIDSAKMTAINTAKSTVKTIISSASGERDLEKMKTYLKEIDERITYNHDAANNSGNIKAGESDYSPWEIIYVFDGDPKTNVVCEGYSKAFKYLCDQSTFTNKTISTYIVTGTLSSGTGAGPHMWNIVRINGKSYLVDPTNCDQDDDAKDIHTYSLKQFMVGAEKQDDGSWKVSWGIQPLEGSKYQIPAGWAGYTYDGETKALYDESELTLSSTDYVEGPTDDHVHTWSDWKVTKAATCTETGTKTRTCSRCSETETEEIPALGHDWGEYKVTKEATCTETGTRTRTCSRCSETEMEEIPAKGHQWNTGAVTKSSTCSQTGVRTYTCTVCGATRTESIPVNPDAHAWRNSWTVARQATVLSDGLLKDVCAYNSAHVRTRGTAKLDATATLNAYSVPLKTRQTSTAVKVTGLGKGDFVASAVSSDMKVVVAGVSGNSIFLKAGKKKGSARVLITMGSGITRVLQVKVQKKKVAAKKVSIQCSKKLVLNQGNTVSINADVMPITTKDKIKYSSSKKKVASVTRNGMITAKKKGKAVITVRCGRKKVKIKVTVR